MTTPSPLIGRWRLISFTEQRADDTQFDVFGANPTGHILYLQSGYMSVLFARTDRKPFSGAWDAVTDREKAQKYDAMVAYQGRFTDHGDRVVHHVETCWIPNWEGRDLERTLTFLPDGKVRLSTPTFRFGRPQAVQDVTIARAVPLA